MDIEEEKKRQKASEFYREWVNMGKLAQVTRTHREAQEKQNQNQYKEENKTMNLVEKLLELAKHKSGYSVDVLELAADYYGSEDCENYKQLDALVEQAIDEQEIIYYENAMKYLAKNDASLQKSIGLASQYGYILPDLSSDVLATILLRDNLLDAWYHLKTEVAALFETESEE